MPHRYIVTCDPHRLSNDATVVYASNRSAAVSLARSLQVNRPGSEVTLEIEVLDRELPDLREYLPGITVTRLLTAQTLFTWMHKNGVMLAPYFWPGITGPVCWEAVKTKRSLAGKDRIHLKHAWGATALDALTNLHAKRYSKKTGQNGVYEWVERKKQEQAEKAA